MSPSLRENNCSPNFFLLFHQYSLNSFTFEFSDTWRLFISGKDALKLDVLELKGGAGPDVVSHGVEMESMWLVSSDGESVMIC